MQVAHLECRRESYFRVIAAMAAEMFSLERPAKQAMPLIRAQKRWLSQKTQILRTGVSCDADFMQ